MKDKTTRFGNIIVVSKMSDLGLSGQFLPYARARAIPRLVLISYSAPKPGARRRN